jgi:hypothetical protein
MSKKDINKPNLDDDPFGVFDDLELDFLEEPANVQEKKH